MKFIEVSLTEICRPRQWPTVPKSQLEESGYPVYGANGQIGFYSNYNHEHKTVLITCRGATCGTINVCEPMSYVTGNAMALDDLDENRVDLRFLTRILEGADFSKVITGVAQPQITGQSLARLKIPLPPLPQQKRIAGILDAADALRAKRREALAQLESLSQSTFLEMFGDPVTNPKGWEIITLAEMGTLDRGVSKHRPRNAPFLLGGKYPLVQTGDVANSEGYIKTFKSTYSESGFRQSKIWPKGTLCITIAANIANTGILTFDSCFPDSVVGFKSEEEGRVEYVQGLFWFFRKILEKGAPQSAQKNIINPAYKY